MRRFFRITATSLILIFIVALGVRAGAAWINARHNSHQALAVIPFMFESGDIAASIAQGQGFSSPLRVPTGPTAWMTPVYPLLLAGIFRLFGIYTFSSYIAATALNIIFASLACIPIYYAGRRISGVALGAGAAWLWAIFPNAILIPFESMWDACLAALLAATILWATLALGEARESLEERGVKRWAAYGLLWGFTLLTNPALASVLPFLLGWLIWRERKENFPDKTLLRAFARPALALCVMILCCVPWTIRNHEALHAWTPLRSVLGLQLWMGNNPHANAEWMARLHPINNAAERQKYISMGEVPYMREKLHAALGYMSRHPARELKLMTSRFVEIWSGGTPHPLQLLLHADAWTRYVLIFNLAAALACLAGIILLWRQRSVYAVPLTAFPVIFPIAYYLTLALPRYRLPIDPIVMLLAAIAIGAAFGRAETPAAPAEFSELPSQLTTTGQL